MSRNYIGKFALTAIVAAASIAGCRAPIDPITERERVVVERGLYRARQGMLQSAGDYTKDAGEIIPLKWDYQFGELPTYLKSQVTRIASLDHQLKEVNRNTAVHFSLVIKKTADIKNPTRDRGYAITENEATLADTVATMQKQLNENLAQNQDYAMLLKLVEIESMAATDDALRENLESLHDSCLSHAKYQIPFALACAAASIGEGLYQNGAVESYESLADNLQKLTTGTSFTEQSKWLFEGPVTAADSTAVDLKRLMDEQLAKIKSEFDINNAYCIDTVVHEHRHEFAKAVGKLYFNTETGAATITFEDMIGALMTFDRGISRLAAGYKSGGINLYDVGKFVLKLTPVAGDIYLIAEIADAIDRLGLDAKLTGDIEQIISSSFGQFSGYGNYGHNVGSEKAAGVLIGNSIMLAAKIASYAVASGGGGGGGLKKMLGGGGVRNRGAAGGSGGGGGAGGGGPGGG